MYGEQYPYFPPKYPAELKEIAEKIASGKPTISWDDILDQLLEIVDIEKKPKSKTKKKAPAKKRPNKKERRVPKGYDIRENNSAEVEEIR